MTILLSLISFFFLNTNVYSVELDSHHVGKWQYEVVSPDITYKGILELTEEDGEYGGSIISEDFTIPLSSVNIDGDDLSFSMNVQGFPCTVKGTFEGDKFKGKVAVEGIQMPMTASRL